MADTPPPGMPPPVPDHAHALPANSAMNVALIVDIENFVISARNAGLPPTLDPIARKVLEFGRLAVRRAYGDLDKACGSPALRNQVRWMMYQNLLQFEDIPFSGSQKNTADMRLTVDTLSLAYTNPGITTYAIVSNDRDYVPLILKLRELGKQIIGIGVDQDSVNQVYVRSCDTFVYYSSLVTGDPTATPLVSSVDEGLLSNYISLLQDAVRSLVERGERPLSVHVAPLMRQLRPDFDPKLVGLASFKDIVETAAKRGAITTSRVGTDTLLLLAEAGTGAGPAPQPVRAPVLNFNNPIELYRGYFESKLKCPIPATLARQKLYRAALMKVNSCEALGQLIGLNTLSKECSSRLQTEGVQIQQSSAFKVLYALFRQEVFKAEPSEVPYNPMIKGAVVPEGTWDELFIRNSLVVLHRENPGWPITAAALADVFDVKVEVIDSILETIDYIR